MKQPDRRPWYWCGLILLVTLAVFARVPTFAFLAWDDGQHIYHNPRFNPVTMGSVVSFWNVPFRTVEKPVLGEDGRPYEQLWQPVPFTAWAALSRLEPLQIPLHDPDGEGDTRFNPAVFHLASLLVHLANVVLVFWIVRSLLRDDLAAAVGALAFAIHPVQVETVVWVTQLNNLLCGFFTLGSVLAFLSFAEALGQSERQGSRNGFYALCTCCFVLACLSKPGAVILPFLLLVLGSWRFPSRTRLIATWILPWFPWILFVIHVNSSLQTNDPGLYVVPWRRFFQAGDALAFYGWKLLLPYAQAVDYARHSNYIFRHWWGYATWIFPAIALGSAWTWRRQKPALAAGVFLFTLGALPTIGFVPYYYHWYSTVSDRYIYVAMLGTALFLGGLSQIARGWATGIRRVSTVFVCCLLGFWGLKTRSDAWNWRDTPSLWEHVIEVTPRSWLARGNLGAYYQMKGDYGRASKLYQQALTLNSHLDNIRYNYALMEQQLGHLENARRQLLIAHTDAPLDPSPLNSLAIMMANEKRYPEALQYWRQALALQPSNCQTLTNMAVLLAMRGQTDEAAGLWRRILTLQPENAEVGYNLGVYLEQHGQLAQAKVLWARAHRAAPNYAPATQALQRVQTQK